MNGRIMAGGMMEHAEMGSAGKAPAAEGSMDLRFLAAANAKDWDGMERCRAAGMHVDAPYKGVAMLHVAAIHGDKEMA